MGFRFRRTLKIAPGIRLNLGKKGISTSIGPRGAKITLGKDGVRTTVGLPGSGLSYTSYHRYNDNVSIPYTPVCPYCGHHMRKAWTNCPKCNYNLLPVPSDNPNPADAEISEEASSAIGCGCLLLIMLVIAFAIYIV